MHLHRAVCLPDRFNPRISWDRPIAAVEGDKNPYGIFTGVGLGLTRWEMVELRLTELYVQFAGRVDPMEFGKITAVEKRKAHLAEAATSYFSKCSFYLEHEHLEADKTATQKLLADYQLASLRRNEIAHGHARNFNIGSRSLGWYLVATPYNPRTTDQTNPFRLNSYMDESPEKSHSIYAYTAENLQTFAQLFFDFERQVGEHLLHLHWSSKNGGRPAAEL